MINKIIDRFTIFIFTLTASFNGAAWCEGAALPVTPQKAPGLLESIKHKLVFMQTYGISKDINPLLSKFLLMLVLTGISLIIITIGLYFLKKLICRLPKIEFSFLKRPKQVETEMVKPEKPQQNKKTQPFVIKDRKPVIVSTREEAFKLFLEITAG